MRYSKVGHLETPRRMQRAVGKWYDLREFLELRDLEDRLGHAPRPPRVREHIDPLASSTDYVPHVLGREIDDPDE